MKEKPVSDYNKILWSLLDETCTSNKLFKKSGLSKNKYTSQIKKDLEKAFLITVRKNKIEKDKKFSSQAHIIELSEFGRKVALFLKNLKEFGEHLDNYLNKADIEIGKYITAFDEGNLKNEIKPKLKKEGWSDSDIENFLWILFDLDDFKIKVLNAFIEIICYKYVYFKRNFDPNSIALDFLKKAIGEEIIYYINYKMEILENTKFNSQYNISEETDKKSLMDTNQHIELTFVGEVVDIIKYVSNKGFIYGKNVSNEIKNIILCLNSLSELTRSNMESYMAALQWKLDNPSLYAEDVGDPRELDLYKELYSET